MSPGRSRPLKDLMADLKREKPMQHLSQKAAGGGVGLVPFVHKHFIYTIHLYYVPYMNSVGPKQSQVQVLTLL